MTLGSSHAGFEPRSSGGIPVKCSYKLSHWSSDIRAEDRWHLSIDIVPFSDWIALRLDTVTYCNTN